MINTWTIEWTGKEDGDHFLILQEDDNDLNEREGTGEDHV